VYFFHSLHNPPPILKQYSSILDIISLRCTYPHSLNNLPPILKQYSSTHLMSPSCISSLDTVYQLNVNIPTVYKITINTYMVHSVFWLRLFLPQNLFIDMKTDYQALCCMTLCSNIVVMFILYVCVKLMMNSAMLY
jgi:hypothetical protein